MPPISESDCPASHPIKGNASSGIYQMPGDAYFDETNPEVCVATTADVQAAGTERRSFERHRRGANTPGQGAPAATVLQPGRYKLVRNGHAAVSGLVKCP